MWCNAVAAVVAGRVEKVLLTTLVGFLFSLVVGLPGCATTSGPLFKESPVPGGKAVLYFYRESAIMGSGVTHELYVNGEYLAEVTNGGYIPFVADPGQVNIVSTQMKDKNLWWVGLSLGMLCIASQIAATSPATSFNCSGWNSGLEQMESQGNMGPGVIEVRANEVFYFKYEGKWGTGIVLRPVSKEIGNQEIQGLNLFPPPPDSQDNRTTACQMRG